MWRVTQTCSIIPSVPSESQRCHIDYRGPKSLIIPVKASSLSRLFWIKGSSGCGKAQSCQINLSDIWDGQQLEEWERIGPIGCITRQIHAFIDDPSSRSFYKSCSKRFALHSKDTSSLIYRGSIIATETQHNSSEDDPRSSSKTLTATRMTELVRSAVTVLIPLESVITS